MSPRVLMVDDDPAMCAMVRAHLVKRGHQVTTRGAAEAAFEELRGSDYDAVITDLQMRGMDGLELCERIVADRPDVPVLVITAFGSMQLAIAAIRVGAYDFVPKPFDVEHLILALDRALQHRALRTEVTRLREAAAQVRTTSDELLGQSPAMRGVLELLDRVKGSDSSVLITGESGTGKELVASALHRGSRRKDGSFVAINCAALPENLLESELFGHVRGAFTDARSARAGLFVQASGGTLFLDEIGELPLGLQPKLLRALQERRVRPVGGETEVSFDARIIAATNRDLDSAVAQRSFRQDLYYRINVITLDLPPLRARGGDILVLAQHFVRRYASAAGRPIRGISPAAAERLITYAWPGNVRELQNCIERAIAVARYEDLVVEDLTDRVRAARPSTSVPVDPEAEELVSMEEIERRYILRVLHHSGGNKKMAARLLGFDRTTLYRKLERYGITLDRRDG